MTKTSRLLAALKDHQPRSAKDLEKMTGISRLNIGALLSYHVKKNNVIVIYSTTSLVKVKYVLVNQVKLKITDAIRLLESYGYTVTK